MLRQSASAVKFFNESYRVLTLLLMVTPVTDVVRESLDVKATMIVTARTCALGRGGYGTCSRQPLHKIGRLAFSMRIRNRFKFSEAVK